MTINLADYADVLEALAQLCRFPPSPPIDDRDPLIRQALEAIACGGPRALQRALGIPDDGIIGPLTRAALSTADISGLLDKIITDHPPSPPPRSRITFTPELAAEYTRLYAECGIRPEHSRAAGRIAFLINDPQHHDRYADVQRDTGVPFYVIGIIHSLESGMSFQHHLHNGDPLTARTVNVPAGRPAEGSPPFSWEASAVDALLLKDLDAWTDWSPPGIAYVLERYNGFGYRLYHPNTLSPYLWSFTSVYGPPEAAAGKYVADGHFDPDAVSEQCGGMAILKAGSFA